ncbi:MAG: ATP-dependent helicase HrpB [Hyphomicrobiaceae bacterium]|nr:ATP-dependent helicase HrpB [Hyphomicrobiaceae bacterium]
MSEFTPPTDLPVDAVLPALAAALTDHGRAVLVAPPGAGKTTRVPLALLDAPWLRGGRIVVLEPRRIAARGAAQRMAHLVGEKLGATIGLRTRLDTRVGPKTRIEVVTDGVFTRMILDDPGLAGVGAVLFDEFHERSLEADLGLALALDARAGLREDLRLLVMSATLEAARVADLLDRAPIIASEGRAHPVATRYLGRTPGARIEDEMTAAILSALRAEHGSILAFLPGQGEIVRTAERLAERLPGEGRVEIAPLYGALDPAAQDRAKAPAATGRRKVVLATSIAETSLTIEGVRVVIDCGLARVPRYEPGLGIARLETIRASRASVDQRRGRAGRTEPGVCYRLWDEAQDKALPAFAEPEIRAADLSGLLLACAEWGVTDPLQLAWLDPPPAAARDAAREGLHAIGALSSDGTLTSLGRAIRALPLPPRLAVMVLEAALTGEERAAAELAALIVERGLGGTGSDIAARLDQFRRDRSPRASAVRRLAEGWARTAAATRASAPGDQRPAASDASSVLAHLAKAFPDRIAKARGNADGRFLLANGRGAAVSREDPLARAPYLVVAELQGEASATRILLAAAGSEADIIAVAGARIATSIETDFDESAGAIRAREVRRLAALTLSARPLAVAADGTTATVLAEGLVRAGLDRLPWSKAQRQLRHRAAFVRTAGDDTVPDLSDDALSASVANWLAPFLMGRTKASEVTADVLGEALDALLPWPARQRLEAAAPTHYTAPTGNAFAIDYDSELAPAVHIRVQELFGLSVHPAIAGGRLPLTLCLLSPAHRPIQITRDLPGFWAGSWRDVKAEMKGRYPKHVWPDDPAAAAPTARAKPRSVP